MRGGAAFGDGAHDIRRHVGKTKVVRVLQNGAFGCGGHVISAAEQAVEGLDGVSLEYADEAEIEAAHSLIHVGRHQQVLGPVQGGDGLSGNPVGTHVWGSGVLWHEMDCPESWSGEEQVTDGTHGDEGKEEYQFGHPAAKESPDPEQNKQPNS